MKNMAETNKESFPNVTHYTHVDVQPGGTNMQYVENFYQADFLKAMGIELEIKNKTTEETPNGRASQCGQKTQYLFTDGDPTVENTKVKNRERDRFLRYLSEHKLTSRSLTCKKDDTLNDVVTCFIHEWRDKGWTAREPSGGAIFRFLTEECGLETEVSGDSYSNKIKERLKNKNYSIKILKTVKEMF